MEPEVTALLILAVVVFLYISELIPLAVTSFGGCAAMVLLGVTDFSTAFSGFSSNVVFLVGGMILVGIALFQTGAAELVGNHIISLTRSNEKLTLLAIMVVAGILSAFLNNSSTCAMFIYIIAGMAVSSRGKIGARRLLMPLAFAANAGGMITLVGSTPPLIVQGVLTQNGYNPLGFFEFALIGLPVFLLVIVYMSTIGYRLTDRLQEPDLSRRCAAPNGHGGEHPAHPRRQMYIALGIMGLCVVLFATEVIPPELTSVLGAFLVLVTGCVTEKEAYESFDWATVLVLAGSLGIARSLDVSGAGRLIADSVLSLGFGDSPFMVYAAILALAGVLTQIMSNTATTAMLAPIALFISQGLGVSPYPMLIGLCTMTAAAFASPVATPPNTMVLIGGYRFKDYLLIGGTMNVLVYLLVVLLVPVIWPF